MLRGLAEYSMSGRRQAVTVAILFGLVPMLNVLSGAIVALVTLRKGSQEGFLVMLWALLPAGLQWVVGDASGVFMLLTALLTGHILRSTQSWQIVLLVITAVGLLTQLSLALQPAYVAQVTAVISQMMAEGRSLQFAEAGQMAEASPEQVVALLLHFYGAYHIVLFTACLILGRYWQALLYNPGGFKQEFHSLRFDMRIMGVVLALLALGQLGVAPFSNWVPLFTLLPLINGLALIHFIVARRKMGMNWLILTYLILFVMAPAIIALGIVDAFADIRKRLKPEQQ